MKTYKRLISISLATVLLIATAAVASAMPPLPSSFYGTVKVDGANVSLDTVVSVWINGVKYAQATVSVYAGDTVYALDVPGDDASTSGVVEGGKPGDTIVFHIGDRPADQTGTWQSGTNVNRNLTATSANRPPTISDIADQTTAEDTSIGPIAFTVGDVETPPGLLTLSAASSNSVLVPVGNIAFGGGGVNRSVTIAPAPNRNGEATITITVSDTDGGTAHDSFILTVTAVNNPPVATNNSYSTNEDTLLTVAAPGVLGNDSDIDGNSLTAVLVNGPAHGTLTLSADGSFVYTPTLNFHGTDTFTYHANDGSADSNVATVTITVNSVNDAPMVTLSGPNSANEGETKHYTYTTSDPDADTFILMAGFPTCGAKGTRSNAVFDGNTGTGSFDCAFPDGSASSTVSVQVKDSDNAPSKTSSITVAIANMLPVVSVNPTSQNVQYSDWIAPVTVSATDVAADMPLSASTRWKKNGGSFTSGLLTGLSLSSGSCGTGTCAWTLTGKALVDAGTYTVTVKVSDDTGSVSADITIVVAQEDAFIQYTGDTIAQVGTNLTLQATVWDSAATSGYLGANPETGSGATIGNITKMWIAFDIYPADSCMSGTPTTRYAPVNDTGILGDGIGTASTTYKSSSEASYCVMVRLVAGSTGGTNQWYTAPEAQPTGITFHTNSGKFAIGGGWINDPNNSKGTFGFIARYNKSGQPQGQMVYVYRGLYSGPCTINHVSRTCTNVPANFVIKSNFLNALQFVGTTYPMTATLQGKATIQINRASNGVQLYGDGNATFTATVVDSGKSSGIGSDKFALTVYGKNGVLYKSVPVTPLRGGNIVIHLK